MLAIWGNFVIVTAVRLSIMETVIKTVVTRVGLALVVGYSTAKIA